jgi:hypothetical protein
MSYFKIGWNWIRLAITRQFDIDVYRFLSSAPDPQPSFASKRQREEEYQREFTVLSRIPAL